jgi:hypothetical protein
MYSPKQCIVYGRVFTLSPDECEIEYDGHRLSPSVVKSLTYNERSIIAIAVEALSALTRKGYVLRSRYSGI